MVFYLLINLLMSRRLIMRSPAAKALAIWTAAKALVVLTAADQTVTPARFKLCASMHVVVSLSAAADAMAPPAPRPLLVEAPLAAATLKNAAAFGRKPTSPPTTLSASAGARLDGFVCERS